MAIPGDDEKDDQAIKALLQNSGADTDMPINGGCMCECAGCDMGYHCNKAGRGCNAGR
jgi:hypothetical protein